MDDTVLRVYVRDASLARLGQVDDYTTLTVVPRFNAVGAYTMEISADSAKAPLLVEGNGLIIRTASGDTVTSGPIRTVDWSRSSSDGGSGKLTVGGIDDTDSLLMKLQQTSSLSLNDIVEMPPPEPPPDYDQTPRMQTSAGENIERKTLVSANSNGI